MKLILILLLFLSVRSIAGPDADPEPSHSGLEQKIAQLAGDPTIDFKKRDPTRDEVDRKTQFTHAYAHGRTMTILRLNTKEAEYLRLAAAAADPAEQAEYAALATKTREKILDSDKNRTAAIADLEKLKKLKGLVLIRDRAK